MMQTYATMIRYTSLVLCTTSQSKN